MSSRAACASQDARTAAHGAKSRDRYGVPCDESQCDQLWAAGVARPGGRKAGGGSHAVAEGHGSEGGGISAPRTSGAVNGAPEARGPARAGSSPSGGFVRLGRERELTPAAERSREPPPASREGGSRELGPGVARQKFLRIDREPGTRKALSARC